MFIKSLSTLIATLLFASVVNAAGTTDLGGTATADANVPGTPLTQTFLSSDDEVVFVASRENNTAFPAVVAALEGAGYRRSTRDTLWSSVKSDTWCKVDVYQARQILGECYTPQMGHGIAVRNNLAWSQHSFKSDYSGVPAMIAKIRDEHRCLSTVLRRKQSSVHGPSLPVLGAPNAPPEGYFATEC